MAQNRLKHLMNRIIEKNKNHHDPVDTSSYTETKNILCPVATTSVIPRHTISPGMVYSTASIGHGAISGASYSIPQPKSLLSVSDLSGKELVRINLDGIVEWAPGADTSSAAEALSRSFHLSVESKAGVNQRIKSEMRNSVFNDIIAIAKSKGALSADDLTYLLEASKIMEKLKGE